MRMASPWTVRVGRRLFALRGYMGVPLFLLVLLLARWNPWALGAGLGLVALGELVRVISVAHSGPTTRSRRIEAPVLVTWGPYAWTRNPIYWGNFLVGLGMTLSSACFPLAILYVPLFWLEYYLIVRAEEAQLLKLFGERYREYAARVPRFGIRPRKTRWRGANFRLALRSERSTILVLGAYYGLLGLRLALFPWG